MAVVAYDSFTDTAGTDLLDHEPDSGGAWKANATLNAGQAVISNEGRARANGSDLISLYHTTEPEDADYEVRTVLHVKSLTGIAGLVARASKSHATAVTVAYDASLGMWFLANLVNNIPTAIDTAVQSLTPGNDYLIRLVVTGTTAEAWVNSNKILEIAVTLTDPGVAGLSLQGGSDTTGLHLDDWALDDRLLEVGRDAPAAWNVRTTAGRDAPAAWNVRTTAGRDAPAAWHVRTTSGRDASAAWNVRTTAGRDTPLAWNIAAVDVVTVGRDAGLGWNVRGLAGRDAPAAWNIGTPVGRDAPAAWTVRTKAGRDAGLAWSIRTQVGRDAGLGWNVRGLAAVLRGEMLGTSPIAATPIAAPIAALPRQIQLEALLIGDGSVDAALFVPARLVVVLAGEGAVEAGLSVTHRLAAVLRGEGVVDAALAIRRELAGLLIGDGAVWAALSVPPIRPRTVFDPLTPPASDDVAPLARYTLDRFQAIGDLLGGVDIFDAFEDDVTFAVADTDEAVVHDLGRLPERVEVVRADAGGIVYVSGRTRDTVTLKASEAGTYRVRVS